MYHCITPLCRNALHLAARSCNVAMLRLLIEGGDAAANVAYVNEPDKSGITALFLAVQKGAPRVPSRRPQSCAGEPPRSASHMTTMCSSALSSLLHFSGARWLLYMRGAIVPASMLSRQPSRTTATAVIRKQGRPAGFQAPDGVRGAPQLAKHCYTYVRRQGRPAGV